MKAFFAAFLVLCAYASLAEGQTQIVQQVRENLLRRADYLINLVSGEVKILEAEGNVLARQGLELELRQLIGVQLQLRATQVLNVTEPEIIGLETVLNAIENRVDQLLTAIGRQFISRQEIDMLLRRTNEFLLIIRDTVVRLRNLSRNVEALGLEREEAGIIQLEIELRATQNSVELRRLEEILVQAEYRIAEIIMGLEAGGVRRKRDLKADILARANELVALANAAVRQLRARNRPDSAEVILQVERQIQLLITDLNATTNATVVDRLQGELINLEFQLTEDLATVGQPIDAQEYRRLLLTVADALQAWATAEIAALTAANQTNQINIINQEARSIAQIAAELRNATTRNQLQELENRLGEAEYRLYEELLRLQRPEAYRRQLIRAAEDLAVYVVIEVRNLLNRNRTLEAEGLIAEEQQLVMLDVELRNAITIADIQAIERRLQGIEERVYAQLVALGLRVTSRRRDLRDDLIARATQLIGIANTTIADLQRTNRTGGVQLLQTAEQQIQALVTELKAATNESQINQLEGRLIQAEMQLVEDLRRLGRPLNLNERRDLLITRAEALQRWAEIQIANARNRSIEVSRIQSQVQTITNIVTNLRNATLQSDLTFLEERLNEAEETLIVELVIIGQPLVPYEQIQALQRRAEELAIRLIVEIRRQRALGKTLIAEGLAAEEQNLIDLDAELRVALTPERIARAEQLLLAAETRIAAELARISGSS